MPGTKPSDNRSTLSRETGTIIKDWGGRLPVALVYPNSYYLGMSNLGVHAIYRLLNGYADVLCERAFWEKDQRAPLGLESGRPLADYPLVAFSLTYELDYFNVAHMLRASGIPLHSAERDGSHPLVIAGGAAVTANPMPLSPFFDCLCIGEAEVILPTLLPALADGVRGSRKDLLKVLARLPGLYVPQEHAGQRVARQWLANLDDFPVASGVLTRDTELGNLYLIEVQRGCAWGCSFCLVSNAFRPVRYRSLDVLFALAEKGLQYRTRIGLVGPAVTDHPRVEELVSGIRHRGAHVSVSSLRIRPLPETVLSAVAQGTRTVALAPEAGSERLRRVLGKVFTEDEILEAVGKTAASGFRHLKLYFMLGLPTETDQDIEEAVALVLKCRNQFDRAGGSRLSLTVSLFVPKAGTPFQWIGMAPADLLQVRLSRLRQGLEPRGIRVRAESLAWSEVQAVLSRGDARLAGVLARMEGTSLAAWRRAIRDTGTDAHFYAYDHWSTSTHLPWAIVDSGMSVERLRSQLETALP